MTLRRAALFGFEEKLEWGEEGEKAVASWLISRGVSVAPLYQFKNHDKAPILMTKEKSLTLPDLTCWHDGQNYFVECKRKNQWVSFKGVIEIGLDQRHFDQYCDIKKQTGQKVFIFFVHENKDPGIYFQEIDVLKLKIRRWDGRKPNGDYIMRPMALFPKNTLTLARI